MMSDLTTALEGGALGWAGIIPGCVGVIAGFMLLIAGNKVLKPVTVVLGAALGGLAGVLLLTGLLDGHTYGCPAALASLAVGAAVGAVVSLAVFRAVLALAGAATFAGVAMLVGAVVLGQTHHAAGVVAGVEFKARDRIVLVGRALDSDMRPDSAEHVVDASRAAAGQAWDHASAAWASVPSRGRGTLILLGLGAGVAGLLAGALMPRRTEAVVTSLLGSAALLASLTWLVTTTELPGSGLVHHGPVGWLVLWLATAGAGAAVQMLSAPKKTPAAAA